MTGLESGQGNQFARGTKLQPWSAARTRYTQETYSAEAGIRSRHRSLCKVILSVCVRILLKRAELKEVRRPVDLRIKLARVGKFQTVLHVGLEPHSLPQHTTDTID